MSDIIHNIKTSQPIRLSSRPKKDKLEPRSASAHELFQWIALHENTFYNKEALSLRKRSSLIKLEGEGHSERAIRVMLDLPYTDADIPTSSATMDTVYGEIKDVVHVSNGKKGKNYTLIPARFNQVARDTWSACRKDIELLEGYKLLSKEERSRITEGKLGVNAINNMPNDVKRIMFDYLAPKNVMKHYPSIFCGGVECYVQVLQDDYDHAWKFSSITMGGVLKYNLNRDYLIERIGSIIEKNDGVELFLDNSSSVSPVVSVQLMPERSIEASVHEVSMTLEGSLKIPLRYLLRSVSSSVARLFETSHNDE